MNRVTVVEAKAHFSELLTQVEAGAEILITRRGSPVVRLSAVVRPKQPLDLAAVDALRSRLRMGKRRSVDLIRKMRDESY